MAVDFIFWPDRYNGQWHGKKPAKYCNVEAVIQSVLRIRDVLSRIRIPNFFIPDPDPGSGE
jgi:hypothetical protein